MVASARATRSVSGGRSTILWTAVLVALGLSLSGAGLARGQHATPSASADHSAHDPEPAHDPAPTRGPEAPTHAQAHAHHAAPTAQGEVAPHSPVTGTFLDFFTNGGLYMPRTHCLMTADGTPDWPWIITLLVLTATIVIGYTRIFWFWAMTYRAERAEDRNNKLMDLAYIFLWCGVCGYGMSLLIFFWPGYRLLAVFLVALNVFTWRFIWSLGDMKVSLSAKRYKRELQESLQDRADELERLVEQRTADLKQARDELTRLAAIAEYTDNAVILTDLDGRVTWVNRSFTRITGFEPDEAIGKKPGSMLQGPDTDPATVARIGQAVRRREPIRAEILNYHKDGHTYWLHLEIQPVRNAQGDVTHFMAIESDMTQIKQAGEQLREARDVAEEANRAKSDFLASMSHEIRTPLNAIIGSIDLLSDTPMQPEQQRFLGIAGSSSTTLLSIINDILDFSKIEAGKLELDRTPFDCGKLIEEAAEIVSEQAESGGIDLYCKIDPPQPCWVNGDPTRLRQVLLNLLSNAIKFTRQGHVRLALAVTDATPEGQSEGEGESKGEGEGIDAVDLSISVEDTGAGIAPSRLDAIFDSFAQEDSSTTRRFGGTGLGLAISRRLVEAMGGRLSVKSRVGAGSTFSIRLTLGRAPAPQCKQRTELTVRRVLVADDNRLNREVVAHHLRRWGVEVVEADSPRSMREALAGDENNPRPIELMILDRRFGDRDGVECLIELHDAGDNPPPPAIVASSLSSSVPAETRQKYGIVASLHKPILPSQLYNIIVGLHGDTSAAEVEASGSDRPESSVGRARLNVLVIDDNRVNRTVAQRTLERFGHACTTAGSARDGIDAVERQRFDLVLMDCHMPETDGYQATAELRERETETDGDPLFIVALTANAMSSDRQRCLDAGMDDYLPKPVRREALRLVLDEAARRRGPAGSVAPRDAAEPPTSGGESASTVAPPPDDSSAFDRDELLDRCMGENDLAAELLGDWTSSIDEPIGQLQRALDEADAEAVRLAAHAVKGSSLEVAAREVARAAATIERAALDGQIEGVREELDSLVAAVDRAKRQGAGLAEQFTTAE